MTKRKTIADPRVLDAIIRTDFASFIQFAHQILSPAVAFHGNWHIDAIAYHLEQVRSGKIKRLIINVPPRMMKSTICSVALPAFWLGHEPAKRFICISYSNELAIKLGNDCRELMNSPAYRKLFPNSKLSRQKNTETEFTTTQRGQRMSASIDGSLTGRGGDVIIVDDPIKPTDALRDRVRERVNSVFFNTIESRLDDKRTGAIIVVMQRLHDDDLVGRLIREQGKEWTVLSLPAIAEQEERIQIGDDRYHVRQVGDLLHAEREPREILERIRSQTPDVFAAQHQQSPVRREGVLIKRDWPNRYHILPERASDTIVVQSWDTASKDTAQSDYSVCTTWHYRDRSYYLVDVTRRRMDYPTLKAVALAHAERHKPNVILIEDAGVGTALAMELKNAGLHTVAIKPEGDKRARMSIHSTKFANGQVLLPQEASWLADLEDELFGFPGSRYDDQVDSISQALAYEIATNEWTDQALKNFGRLFGTAEFYMRYAGR
ncbi:phage terminase large subunit [Bradyrhizobium jicamae]|uniref:phage terminase large subunit n=1 Tax=Bradyrhizobium jicamae TaxID=280332 RepID=UPI001BAA317C|nr:phage terminase large subunit [Bradyrhizobium jicamae]MBR0938866.1 phage terminase large subunit [Bradyrhizobium jicamae]